MTYSLVFLAATWLSGESYPVPIVPAPEVAPPTTPVSAQPVIVTVPVAETQVSAQPEIVTVPVAEPNAFSPAATISPAPAQTYEPAPAAPKRKGFLRRMLPWNWGKQSSPPAHAKPVVEPAPTIITQPATIITQPATTPVSVRKGATTAEPPLAADPTE